MRWFYEKCSAYLVIPIACIVAILAWFEGGFSNLGQLVKLNRELFTLLLVPILTVIVTAIVTVYTNNANLASREADRELQKRIRIRDAHQAKVEEFRRLSSEYEQLCFSHKFDISNGLSSGVAGHQTKARVQSLFDQLIGLKVRIQFVGLEFLPAERKELEDAMDFNFREIGETDKAAKLSVEERFVRVANRILMRLERENTVD